MTAKITFILLAGILASCSTPNAGTKPIPANQMYMLSETDRFRLEKMADAGDGSAAFKLYQYYQYGLFNNGRANMWLRRSAEQGHIVAQYNLGYTLVRADKPETKNEGVKWLRSAAKAGFAQAGEVLRDMGYDP